jgi:hypothetical protein
MLALMASSHAPGALCAQVASPPSMSGHLAFAELTLNQAVQMAQDDAASAAAAAAGESGE